MNEFCPITASAVGGGARCHARTLFRRMIGSIFVSTVHPDTINFDACFNKQLKFLYCIVIPNTRISTWTPPVAWRNSTINAASRRQAADIRCFPVSVDAYTRSF